MLGPIKHQPAQRHQSPSYFRQQERRAARQSSEESDSNKVVAEEVATETKEKNAAEDTLRLRKLPKISNVKYVILKVIEQLDCKFT